MTIQEIQSAIDAKLDARQIINMIADYIQANPGGGGGLTIYTGDGSLAGDRTVDLNGHSLIFHDGGGEEPFKLNRTVGFESSTLVSKDGIGTSYLDLESNVNSGYVFYLVSYNGTNTITIEGDAVANSLEYTADTHTFNGAVITPDLIPLDFADDAAAAVGLVPVGGLYHTSGALKLRLS